MRIPFFLTIAAALAAPPLLSGQQVEAIDPVPDPDPAYTTVLEKRVGGILDTLQLEDPARADRVAAILKDQYRGLKGFQDARDLRIKLLRDRADGDKDQVDRQVQAERDRADAAAAALNDAFLAKLATELKPEQVDRVKDAMTYNKLGVTYAAYLDMLPDLTPEQKKVVHETLTQARDRAVYAGSAEEKSEVFNKYKGRVNNYLSEQGYDLKLATKEWAERRKQAK